MTFWILLLVAFLVEAIWEALKKILAPLVQWLQGKGFPVDQLGALIVALLLCFGLGSQVDFFAIMGIPLEIAFLGIVLTAILLSRGSNFIHDLIGAVEGLRQNYKTITYIDAGMGPEGEPPVAFVKIADKPAPEDEPGEVG